MSEAGLLLTDISILSFSGPRPPTGDLCHGPRLSNSQMWMVEDYRSVGARWYGRAEAELDTTRGPKNTFNLSRTTEICRFNGVLHRELCCNCCSVLVPREINGGLATERAGCNPRWRRTYA
jgi:hypothetical protein